MAFNYDAGVTAPAAPDEIVDWFATFEAWITGVGWTVASGAGTTDLFLSSPGEAGGLTKLFVHVWRDGVNVNRVHLEVSDDAVPTHQTTRGGYVDSGGAQFAYFMSADLDAMVIVFKFGAAYRMVYGGLVWPFALTVTDETYHSIATDGIRTGTILRRHDGAWDQDDTLYENDYITAGRRDRVDGSLTIGGVYFGDNADIAGQLKHVSCEITDPPTNPEDVLSTGQPGATTDWIILTDSASKEFALRTGGILPVGTPDGSFSYTTGAAATMAAWFSALVPWLQAIGWTATDISGVTGRDHDWEFHSAGETGSEDIWVRITQHLAGVTYHYVADSAYGTPGRHETTGQGGLYLGAFPTTYYFCGDLDCFLTTAVTTGPIYTPMWHGLISVFAPGLPDSYHKVATISHQNGLILYGHIGLWSRAIWVGAYGDGSHCMNSNPNNYDGTTYMVWPMTVYDNLGSFTYEPIGTAKYYFFSHGGGIANLDTITVAGRTYTIFFRSAPNPWAMRTV